MMLILLAEILLLHFVVGDGHFFVIPRSTTVFLNDAVHLECGTNGVGSILAFVYETPPGVSLNIETTTERLQNGGSKITATFIMTEELNTTTVVCVAAGTTYRSNPATVHAYALPRIENIRICQLDRFVFLSWDQIFAPDGVNVRYEIKDNRGADNVTSDPNHSFTYSEKGDFDYVVNITVITVIWNPDQTISKSKTNLLSYKLNGSAPLMLKYNKDLTSRENDGDWELVFRIELNRTHECPINKNTLMNGTLVNCKEKSNCINSSNIDYNQIHHEINSTNHLPPRNIYNSTLCINYFGKEITSQSARSSTHDLQDIQYMSNNETHLCLRFHLIHHYEVAKIHLHIEKDEITVGVLDNVIVPSDIQNGTSFVQCPKIYKESQNIYNRKYSLLACDGPGNGKCQNAAVRVDDIVLRNPSEPVETANSSNNLQPVGWIAIGLMAFFLALL